MKIGRFWPRTDILVMALIFVAPFIALLTQAGADQWFGTTLIPQQMGTRGIRSVWADPYLVEAIRNSLLVAMVVAGLSVLVAWPAARYLAGAPSAAAWWIMAGPILMPPLVVGDGLSSWFIRLGIGSGLMTIGIAHLVVSVPYAVLSLVPAFDQRLDHLEATAGSLGASPGRTLFGVSVPASFGFVAVGLALSFTVSWSQYGTSLGVGGGTPMLPLVLVPFVRSDPQVAAVLDLVFLSAPALLLIFASRAAHVRAQRRAANEETTVAANTRDTDKRNGQLVG